MVWYGESYRIAGGTGDIGAWEDHYDGQSQTVTAGDDFIVGAYADPVDWAAFADYADPITVRWVLEVASGSGTLHLSTGLDPDWTYDNPTLATQDLGDVTASGPGTLVSDPVSVDHATLAAQSAALIVRIQCVAGAVEVAQVKLRVWPSAGAGGAWVPAGEGTAQNYRIKRRGKMRAPGTQSTGAFISQVLDYESYPDPDGAKLAVMDAQPGAIAQLAAAVGETADFNETEDGGLGPLADAVAEGKETLVVMTNGDVFYQGTASVNTRAGYIWADMSQVSPDVETPGIDPNEHRYETEAFARPVGGGPLVPTFAGWTTATLRAAYGRPLSPGAVDGWAVGPAVVHQVTVGETVGTTAPFTIVAGGATTTIPAGVEGIDWQVVQDIPVTGGEAVLVGAEVPGVLTPTESVAGLLDADYFGAPVHAYRYSVVILVDIIDSGHLVNFGPIEVYNPGAVPSAQPRFYVKHRDDTMRPVGFGKPATELTVFRVPGRGRWRDLTSDEYATFGPTNRPPGGMPLKVKRLDAGGQAWWDHVGWMIPDA